MKEKIFKLLNTYTGPDYHIGRELFVANYKDFIVKRDKNEKFNGEYIIEVSLDDLEELFQEKFDRKETWAGIWWYKKDLQ